MFELMIAGVMLVALLPFFINKAPGVVGSIFNGMILLHNFVTILFFNIRFVSRERRSLFSYKHTWTESVGNSAKGFLPGGSTYEYNPYLINRYLMNKETSV